MRDGYRYGYLMAGYGKARWRRVTIADRIRAWRKRRQKRNQGEVGGWIA